MKLGKMKRTNGDTKVILDKVSDSLESQPDLRIYYRDRVTANLGGEQEEVALSEMYGSVQAEKMLVISQ